MKIKLLIKNKYLFDNLQDNIENNIKTIDKNESTKNNSLLKPEEVVYQIIHLGLVEYEKRQFFSILY